MSVPAAAGKNTRDVAGQMIKIFYIVQAGIKREYEELLLDKGAALFSFRSIDSVRYRAEDSPDLIIIEKAQSRESSFREFLKKFRETPIIVLADNPSFSGISAWLRAETVCPLFMPAPRELELAIEKLLHEKRLITENRNLTHWLAITKQELAFFEEVSKTLTSTIELNEVLGAIMKKATPLIKAAAWSILLLDEETGELFFEKTAGKMKGKKKIKKERLKLGEGIAGWVAREKVPVVVPDVSKDSRFSNRIDRETDFKTKSIMCVPIMNKGNILGVLELVNKTTNAPFTRDDLDLVLRIVDHAAIAIERSALYQKMTELSLTDDLTKLFNTRYLNRSLDLEISRASRHHTSLSLIFMDIDHFKHINDNYGHLVGSKLLVEMGQLLLKCLRTVDIVARYGGDEFVMVLPQTHPRSASQIAERVRRAIERNTFLKRDGYSFRITASFGVASYPESAKSKEELLKLADDAMYRVKNQTRNGVYAIV